MEAHIHVKLWGLDFYLNLGGFRGWRIKTGGNRAFLYGLHSRIGFDWNARCWRDVA